MVISGILIYNVNNKRSMENIDKIKCVLIDFENNNKTLNEAANEILRLFSVSKRCSHCLYRKYRPNARYKYETNRCQISGYNLTDVENHSCEHYKPIHNVC